MKHLDLVIWLICWPCGVFICESLCRKLDGRKELSKEETKGFTNAIFYIWIIVAIVLF